MREPKTTPWWDRSVHADRRPLLAARGRIKQTLRQFFAAQEFVEVEAAILQASPGNEAHLHAFATEIAAPSGARARLYLHTSPEFACKKLLAAGERRIFEFARVFRNRERGALHHPEFTLLEWYRAHEPYDGADGGLRRHSHAGRGGRGREATAPFAAVLPIPLPSPERLTVAEAFDRFAGIDLLATVTGRDADREALAAAARKAGVRIADDDNWSDLFSRILVERVEPHLGIGRPTFLYEYPAIEAALARPTPADPRVAERFELYACGVELANGFGEFTDAAEQRRRFEAEMAEKERVHGERYPIDEEFLAALAQMPPASGCALGLDRLVMLTTGAPHIEQVLWTPVTDPQ